jgi:hypothetical protein
MTSRYDDMPRITVTPAKGLQILHDYARGRQVADIAAGCHVGRADVFAVLASIGWQRSRAAELLRRYDRARLRYIVSM